MSYKNPEEIATKYWISLKTFYNVRNTSEDKIRKKKQWRNIYYDDNDFLEVLKKNKTKFSINNDYETNFNVENTKVENTKVERTNGEESKKSIINEEIKKFDINSDDFLKTPYINQLLSTIEELKNEKNEEKLLKNELTGKYDDKIREIEVKYESKIEDLQSELKIETKKLEKVYFLSDRYDKITRSQNELLLNLISLSKRLQNWNEISLNDLKNLLSQHINNESISIDSVTWDIKLISNSKNMDYYNELEKIDNDTIIEKSRRQEIEKLKKIDNVKTILIAILVISVLVFIIYIFYK